MKTKTTITLSVILVLIATAAGLAFWNQFPPDMASHWNAQGNVDGTMSKPWAILLLPAVATVMLALFIVLPGLDPLSKNIATFRPEFNLFIFLMMLFMVYVYALTLVWNLGFNTFSMTTAILPAMGLVFIGVAKLMENAKRNYFIGIRTPWTLASDLVWDKTHKLGSKLFTAAGVVTIAGIFFGDLAFWLLMVSVLLVTITSFVYSYIEYRKIQMNQ